MAKDASHHYLRLLEDIRKLASSDENLPLTISQQKAEALLHVVHDVGGQPDGPIDKSLHKPVLWEKRTHCTAECLAWRGAWVAEERRRRENDLGDTLYFGTPYYARWLLAAAKMLIDKGHITPDELMEKIAEVHQRESLT